MAKLDIKDIALSEILEFLETSAKKRVSFTDLRIYQGCCKITIRTRIKKLVELGLVKVKTYGRRKLVYLKCAK